MQRATEQASGAKTCIRLVIVDDHKILRDGLRALFATEQDILVVGEAEDGREALECVVETKPDAVIMDLSMPHMNGPEAIQDIKRRLPQTKIIVLTLHKAEDFVRAALDAGADGYVLKQDSHEKLLDALRAVTKGDIFLSPSICADVVAGYLRGSGGNGVSAGVLTPRERQVVKLIAEGYRNKEIARHLSLSTKTIEKHRSNFMKKLRLHNTAEITVYAIENNLITSEMGDR
ncbi:MAG: response regulator transcription factor [Gammaproteobacteria bacterium]|nr:response regulator transcription factor [Gammaproteobacteria bacterium]